MNREAERKRFLSARRTAGSTLPGAARFRAAWNGKLFPARRAVRRIKLGLFISGKMRYNISNNKTSDFGRKGFCHDGLD